MATANGISSLLIIKKQSAEGTKATAGSAKYYRRVTGEFNTSAEKYTSNEIRPSQQVFDTRLGGMKVDGAIKGELSCNTYSELQAAVLRKDFVAGPTSGPVITIGATAGTLTDSANAFITAGFKVGMIVRASGFVATANNAKNLLVTTVTAGVLTVSPLNGVALTVEAAGATVTVVATGKRSYVPTSAHTKDFFTVEIADPDITVFRTFIDCMPSKMDMAIQANGMTSCDFSFVGKSEDAISATAYFTTPTAATATGNFSGATSILNVNGIATVICTGMNLSIDGGNTVDSVIGSKYATVATRKRVTGSGSFTVFLSDSTYLEYFRNETEISISYAMAASTSASSDAMSFCAPRIKITSATVNDGEVNKIVTCNYDMLEYTTAATQFEQSTIVIQDTTL
jgi:hypothetical protein